MNRRGGVLVASRLRLGGGGGDPQAVRDALVLGAYKPDASTTGVLPGTNLRTANTAAELVATDGTTGLVGGKTYENWLINFILLPPTGTARIVVKNSFLQGLNSSPGDFVGLAKLYNANHCPMDFFDCTLRPRRPSRFWNGFHGHDFTAMRCDISQVVDALSVFNTAPPTNGPVNVAVRQCYIHDFWWNAFHTGDPSASQPTGENAADGSHNDGCQLQGGSGFLFQGNLVDGFNSPEAGINTYYTALLGRTCNYINAPLTLQDNVGSTTGADIQFNWLYGGAVQVNITGAVRNFGILKNNVFGRDNRTVNKWILRNGITVDTGSGATANHFEDDGSVVPVN